MDNLVFTGKHVTLDQEQYMWLSNSFYWVDTYNQLLIIDAWLEANPKKRPKKNIKRFLVNWFQKQPKQIQDVKQGILQTKEPIKVKAKILEKYQR